MVSLVSVALSDVVYSRAGDIYVVRFGVVGLSGRDGVKVNAIILAIHIYSCVHGTVNRHLVWHRKHVVVVFVALGDKPRSIELRREGDCFPPGNYPTA